MAEEKAPTPEKKKLPIKGLIILVAIMALEGGVFAMWMSFSGPRSAEAGQASTPVTNKAPEPNREIKIVDIRPTNNKSGRMYYYDMSVVVECTAENAPKVEDLCKKREAHIQDALATIVRRAEPQHLQEPDLETLRRQFAATLKDVFGEDAIVKVLIPKCTPIPAF